MSEINLLRVAIIGTQKKFYALTTPSDLENVKNSYRKRQSKQRERNHIQTNVETYKQTLSKPCFQISQLLYAKVCEHFLPGSKNLGHDKTLRGANHASRVIHDKKV